MKKTDTTNTKLEAAIAVLQKQLADLDAITGSNYNGYSGWRSQTVSFYSDYFGVNSQEYGYLNAASANTLYLEGYAVDQERDRFIGTIKSKVKQDIDTLRIKGLPKQPEIPKINFLYRINDSVLVSIIIFVITALLGVGSLWGKYLSDTQNIELKQEVKFLKDSIAIFKIPIPQKADAIPEDTTKKTSQGQ